MEHSKEERVRARPRGHRKDMQINSESMGNHWRVSAGL